MKSCLSENQLTRSINADVLFEELKETLQNLFNSPNEQLLQELSQKFIWKELASGQQLFKQGDPGGSLFLVISGRLKAVINEGTNQETIVGEISKGASVGEMALMTGEARTASVYALRDSVLVELNKAHFEELIMQHPSFLMSFSRIIIGRLTYTMQHTKAPAKNYNIALVPATPDIPLREMAQQLAAAMATNKKVLHLNYDTLPLDFRNNDILTRENSLKLNHWLTTQEMHYDYILYEANPANPAWLQKCLRQADKIVVVVDAEKGPDLSDLEAELFTETANIYKQTKELVILYPAATEFPAVSHKIVATRPLNNHYNIRLGDQNHLNRLARMLTNTGIGLVLSGGGSRGFAHIGIFKALKEKGIPIDMVCGTSIGAIIAAGIALDYELNFLMQQYRQAFVEDKPLSDYTLPVISFLKGHKLMKINHKYFKDFHIEDLWLNFFCVSSNYTTSELFIHHKGPLYKAVTASASIPGVLPPVVEGNHLLVDGGVVNNFPVDIMKAKFGGKLIGIDLKVEKEYKLNYTQLPGGWYLFFAKFLPFLKRYKAPGIATVMMKSTLLASTQHQRQMVADVDLYLRPPVADFGLLNLQDFDKIVQTGYAYAQETLTTEVSKAFAGK